ncbi:MAG: hypothetical protein RLY86_2380 [Pseudomonadota bacterium]|jgi:hypothetical protein
MTIAGKALGKEGMTFGALLADWASIMGSRLSEQTSPLKLVFPKGKREGATLHLRVTSPAALLLQHEEPQVLERINAFFGWRAVARLKLVHGAPAIKTGWRPPPPLPRLTRQQEEALKARTAALDNPDLRDALERLGRAIGPPPE